MLKNIGLWVIFFFMAFSPVHSAVKAESLEEGIEQLAIDIAEQMKAKGIQKIAIDDFTDLNGYQSALGDFISEELVTNFYTLGAGSFEVVERRELARVLKEQKLGSSGLLNKDSIAKIGEVLGIDAIVTGSIAYLGRNIKVNARMLGVNDAKVFAATSQKISKDETVEVLLSQRGRIRNDMGLASAATAQAQSIDSLFENEFLVARPTALTADGNSLVLNILFENKMEQVLYLACESPNSKSTRSRASLVGNMGMAIDGSWGKVTVTGVRCTNNAPWRKYYTEIPANSKTRAIFRFDSDAIDSKSTEFSLNMPMFKHSGSGEKYTRFMIGIPSIRLQESK